MGDIDVVIESDCTYEDVAMEVRDFSQGKRALVFGKRSK